MKYPKVFFSIVFVVMLLVVYLSGDGILLTLEIQGTSILLFLIVLIFLSIKYVSKLVLFFIYTLTVFFVLYSINNIPFLDNQFWINIKVAVLPVITVLCTYLVIIKMPDKESHQINPDKEVI